METEIPKKRYTVKNWEVRLKSGSMAEFNIREDKGESYTVQEPWMIWKWPALKRESKILVTEVAAIDYQEIEQEELKLYKPKKVTNAKTEERINIGRDSAEEAAYIPKITRDDQA